jgi:hypothetical protein
VVLALTSYCSFGLNSYTTTIATGERNDLDLDGGVETVQHDKHGKLIGNPAQCDWLKDGMSQFPRSDHYRC